MFTTNPIGPLGGATELETYEERVERNGYYSLPQGWKRALVLLKGVAISSSAPKRFANTYIADSPITTRVELGTTVEARIFQGKRVSDRVSIENIVGTLTWYRLE